MAVPNHKLFPSGKVVALKNLFWEGTPESPETTNEVFEYTEAVVRVLGAWGFLDVVKSVVQPDILRPYMIWLKPSYINESGVAVDPELSVYNPKTSQFDNMTPDLFVYMIIDKSLSDVTLFPSATSAVRGMMSKEDKAKLDTVQEGANKYTHPNSNGNLHVPPVTNTDVGRFLKAKSNTGESEWKKISVSDLDETEERKFISEAMLTALQTLLDQHNISVNNSIVMI